MKTCKQCGKSFSGSKCSHCGHTISDHDDSSLNIAFTILNSVDSFSYDSSSSSSSCDSGSFDSSSGSCDSGGSF